MTGDTAYRSNRPGFISRVHRKKPRGRPMPKNIEHGNRARSRTRARVEHPFAEQKDRMGLFIRTIGRPRQGQNRHGQSRAYNLKLFVWCQGRSVPA